MRDSLHGTDRELNEEEPKFRGSEARVQSQKCV
jgi:hypothetical protein